MKKLNLLMLIALVYTLFSCREELQYTENFTPPKPHQDGIAKNISFSGFNRETGVLFSEASLSINKVMTDKNGKSSLRDFDIDTTFIKKFTYQKTKNSYSLRAFKRGEDPSKGIYNIVYYYDGSIWKNDIYKLTYSSEFLQKYNSNTLLPFAGTIEHIGTGYNKDSSQAKSGDVYTCSWSTGQLCYCAGHTPSQCSGCESGFRTVTTITCSPADGSGNGGTGSNTTIPPPSLGSPPFNDNPGGGNTNPIGDYEFYNNLPVFDDPRYLEYNWKYNLWNKLSSRLSFDPELYSKFEDFQVLTKGKRLADLEYLASFAEQKSQLTHYAIIFLTQNLNVSWSEFQPMLTFAYDFLQKNTDIVEPEKIFTRLKNLDDALIQNPNLLLDIPCDQLDDWKDVATHPIPQSVKNKLKNINTKTHWYQDDLIIQNLDNAKGKSLNMDLFTVKISSLPNKPGTTQKFTPKDFFDYFRLNLNNFAEKFTPVVDIDLGVNDTTLWNSTNPLGSLISIYIPVVVGNNNGTVICSGVATNTWVFTTITSPWDSEHPVSGNRFFSYYMDGNDMYLYTRGVDRVNLPIFNYLSPEKNPAFNGADKLWTGMQANIKKFIKDNGGGDGTTIISPTTYRPDWVNIMGYIKGKKTLNSLGCK